MQQSNIHYVMDAKGNPKSVIVPIKPWLEIESAQETAYLLKNKTMKKRLLDALKRTDGIPVEVVREKLGI
ncbi:MAG: prevent-host-death protein [Pseudomonadota bacterium]